MVIYFDRKFQIAQNKCIFSRKLAFEESGQGFNLHTYLQNSSDDASSNYD